MPPPFVRKDVWTLAANDPTLQAYADAIAAMQGKSQVDPTDPTGWTYQAAIHGSLSSSPLPEWNQCRHQSWYFVSWHRMYVYYFERIVRAQVIDNGGPKDWALPYWNYDGGGNHNTLPLAFRSPGSPLFVQQRNPGINSGAGLSPSITSPAIALGRPLFVGTSEFGGGATSWQGQFMGQTGRLEQTPHNDVHVAIGGLMGNPDTAALDPIFWLHHANIDRVWWLWQGQPPHVNPTQPEWPTHAFEFSDVGGVPAMLAGSQVEDIIAQLGYTYDAAPVTVPPPRKRPPMNWPHPWPKRPGPPPEPDPRVSPDDERQLVGATDKPIRLVGDATTVEVPIDEATMTSLRAKAEALPHRARAYVDVENIDAARNPGTVYGVYVNLPENASEGDVEAHHVGNISLFGVERARDPRGDEGPHSYRVSMEITDLLDHLAAEGVWKDGQKLAVTFRPISLIAPEGEEGLAAAIPAPAHPDVPIDIGRVSVHYA